MFRSQRPQQVPFQETTECSIPRDHRTFCFQRPASGPFLETTEYSIPRDHRTFCSQRPQNIRSQIPQNIPFLDTTEHSVPRDHRTFRSQIPQNISFQPIQFGLRKSSFRRNQKGKVSFFKKKTQKIFLLEYISASKIFLRKIKLTKKNLQLQKICNSTR